MDASEQYIKMCKEAEEIQKLRQDLITRLLKSERFCADEYIGDWFAIRYSPWKEGDYQIELFHHDNDEGRDLLGEYSQFDNRDYPSDWEWSIIWLPRQDQLQEMIGDFETCLDLIDRWESLSSLGYTYIYEQKLTSMEQLWLSIVMKEKYNKVWDGEKWGSKNS